MEKSQSVKEIGKALSTFHTKMEKIKKDANNPYFKSRYASLSNILEQIQLPMAESGLSFAQLPDGDCLTTILIHNESGEYFQSCYNIHPVKNDPQGIGSAISYARRYALSAILGLLVDDDDDGNAASGKPSNGQENKQAAQDHKPGTITPNAKAETNGNYPPDTRPWLSEAQYNSALERINNGEAELFAKLEKEFRMKKAYRESLQDCAKLSHSLNQ